MKKIYLIAFMASPIVLAILLVGMDKLKVSQPCSSFENERIAYIPAKCIKYFMK